MFPRRPAVETRTAWSAALTVRAPADRACAASAERRHLAAERAEDLGGRSVHDLVQTHAAEPVQRMGLGAVVQGSRYLNARAYGASREQITRMRHEFGSWENDLQARY
jgi:hypothetical protein